LTAPAEYCSLFDPEAPGTIPLGVCKLCANLSSADEQMPAPSIFGEPTKTLSVVVPAYNEEERLAPMLEEMLAFLQKRRDRQVGSSPDDGCCP